MLLEEVSLPVTYCLSLIHIYVIDKGRVMQQAFRGMTLLDYAINASLVLSYVAMQKEDKAGLVTFDEHFDTFVPASKQPGYMQTLLEKLYSQKTTFGETDFSALCVHPVSYTHLENIANGEPMAVYGGSSEVPMFLGITLNNIMVSFNCFVIPLQNS